jgi:hypothetical protein
LAVAERIILIYKFDLNEISMKRKLLLELLFFFVSINCYSQSLVTQSEGNESTIFPAPGWKANNDPNATLMGFSRTSTTSTSNPTATALSGGGSSLIMINSHAAPVNEAAYLITKPYDFSNNGGVNPTFSFWMYRDNTNLSNNDKVEVYWNNIPTSSGMVAINHGSGVNFINRPISSFPIVPSVGWYQYTFTLPAASYQGKKNYFIIKGISQFGSNMYLDNFVCNTYPSAMTASDVSFDLVQQNQSTTSQSATNQWIVGVRCIVGGNSGCGNLNGPLPIKLDSLLFNTNGTSNVSNIVNAKIYYTGGSRLFSTGYLSPFPTTGIPAYTSYPKSTFGSTISSISTNLDFTNNFNSCFFLEYDTTYFWITYNISATALGGNFLDADFRGASVGGTALTCPSPAGTSLSLTPLISSLAGGVQVDIPYCIPSYYNTHAWGSFTTVDYVAAVSLAGFNGTAINSTSNSPALQDTNWPCYPNCPFVLHPPDYELHNAVTGQTAILQQGGSYSISVTAGSWTSSNNIRAWIDYNHNGVFEAAESLGSTSLAGNATAIYPFTVPAAGFTGSTRLRVREVFGTLNPDPCATYSYGECEDFTVTIIPNCSSAYSLWLGNTEEWNNPANWCPLIPTINDDVVINKSLASTPGIYYNPIIRSGITAYCKNLTISASDTLTINATNPAAISLKAKGTITNNGQIKVVTSHTSTLDIANGTLQNLTQTPFPGKSYKAAQTQIIYTASELSALGLIAGDQITAIKLIVKNNDVVVPSRQYSNFFISYLNSSIVPNAYSTTDAVTGGFSTVYSNAAQLVSYGINTFTLSSPITWNGIDNICLQYCYTNIGLTGSANNDFIDITQTTGRKSVLILGRIPASTSTSPLPGAFLNQVAGDIAANGSNSPNVSQAINVLSEFRPNASFEFSSPYGKPKIVVQGDWINNNSFIAGNSSFVMDSSNTNHIGGTQPSSFYTFTMSKTSAGTNIADNRRPIILDNDITIQDTFYLSSGQMIMNGKTITMNNPKPSAFWRTQLTQASGTIAGVGSGFLISENPNSIVNWNIGLYSAPSVGRAVPFGNRLDTLNASITYLPVTFLHKAGDLGTFKAATKYWAANSPITDPSTVTHINTYNSSANNANQTVDRYWMIGKTGPQNPAANFPTVDLTFRFSNTASPASERPVAMSVLNQGKAQPWRSSSSQWLRITSNPNLNVFSIPIGGVSANGSTITFTTSLANSFVVGQTVNITGIVPAGYNIVGATVTAVTVTTFTISSTVSLGPSTVAGTVTGLSAPGGMNFNTQQTSLNYTQSYAHIASSLDSVRVTNWDWPIAPFQGPPVNFPSAAVGDFTAWTITTDNSPLGASFTPLPITINTLNIANASCPGVADGSLTIQVLGGTPPYTYQWSSGVTSQNLTNLLAGTYTVTVTDVSASTATATFTIANNSLFPGSIGAIIGNASACLPSTTIYSIAAVANATNYQWTVPANATIISGQGTDSIEVSFNGSYTSGDICVIASNACGSTNASCLTVIGTTIIPTTPSAITGNNFGVCNSTRIYSVTNVIGVYFNWSVPNGATIISGQGTNAISVLFTNTFSNGAISVYGVTACATSSSRSKTIYGKPNTPTILSGVSTICAGDTVTFVSSIVSGTTSYIWTVPTNAVILTGQGTTTIKVKCIGGIKNGSVCVRAENGCGVSPSNCYTVNAGGIPATITTINGSANGVCNSTKTYSVTNQIGVTFAWTVPSGATILSGQGTNNISVSFASGFVSGTITVVASSSCGSSTSLSKLIRAIASVPASISGPTINCYNDTAVVYTCASSAGATSYDWTAPAGTIFNSGQGTNSVNVSFNAPVGSTSPIKVRATNACGSSAYKSLNLTFSQCFVRASSEANDIQLYPNPASNEVTIDLGGIEDQTISVKCVNTLGQVVYENESASQDATLKINTASFAEGLYYVTLNNSTFSNKVLKMIISR